MAPIDGSVPTTRYTLLPIACGWKAMLDDISPQGQPNRLATVHAITGTPCEEVEGCLSMVFRIPRQHGIVRLATTGPTSHTYLGQPARSRKTLERHT